jgi:hypothetical protein
VPFLKSVLGEHAAHPLDLGALLWRAEVTIELPDCPAEEVVRRLEPWPRSLRDLQPPHDRSLLGEGVRTSKPTIATKSRSILG